MSRSGSTSGRRRWAEQYEEFVALQHALDTLNAALADTEKFPCDSPARVFAATLCRRLDEITRIELNRVSQRQLLQRLYLWFCSQKECLPDEVYSQVSQHRHPASTWGANIQRSGRAAKGKTNSTDFAVQYLSLSVEGQGRYERQKSGSHATVTVRPVSAQVRRRPVPSRTVPANAGTASRFGLSQQHRRPQSAPPQCMSRLPQETHASRLRTVCVGSDLSSHSMIRVGQLTPSPRPARQRRPTTAGGFRGSRQQSQPSVLGGVAPLEMCEDLSVRKYDVHFTRRAPWSGSLRPRSARSTRAISEASMIQRSLHADLAAASNSTAQPRSSAKTAGKVQSASRAEEDDIAEARGYIAQLCELALHSNVDVALEALASLDLSDAQRTTLSEEVIMAVDTSRNTCVMQPDATVNNAPKMLAV